MDRNMTTIEKEDRYCALFMTKDWVLESMAMQFSLQTASSLFCSPLPQRKGSGLHPSQALARCPRQPAQPARYREHTNAYTSILAATHTPRKANWGLLGVKNLQGIWDGAIYCEAELLLLLLRPLIWLR